MLRNENIYGNPVDFQDYNGYSNWSTWVFCLNLCNNEANYTFIQNNIKVLKFMVLTHDMTFFDRINNNCEIVDNYVIKQVNIKEVYDFLIELEDL